MKTITGGNIFVEDIKVGDIQYEFDLSLNLGTTVQVLTLPVCSEEGQWSWTSENISTGLVISYLMTKGNSHYAPKLFDYKAYIVKHWV